MKSYLWNDPPGAVAVANRGGDSAPTGTTALLPRRPRTPLTVHSFRASAVRHAHPLVAPLRERTRRRKKGEKSHFRMIAVLKIKVLAPYSPQWTVTQGNRRRKFRNSKSNSFVMILFGMYAPLCLWCWSGRWCLPLRGCCWLCSGYSYSYTTAHCTPPAHTQTHNNRPVTYGTH